MPSVPSLSPSNGQQMDLEEIMNDDDDSNKSPQKLLHKLKLVQQLLLHLKRMNPVVKVKVKVQNKLTAPQRRKHHTYVQHQSVV